MTISRTFTAALTVLAIAVPAAQAQQDLRSPDARDAGRAVPMTSPSNSVPEPASPVATDGGGAEWGTIGIAGAVTVLAAGGLALVLIRRSRRAHRMGATA